MQVDGQAAVSFLLDEVVGPAVPDLDRAGAVVPLRDLTLEGRVLERVVFDVHGEVLGARVHRHAFRHGPAREHALALEAKVVVKPAGIVPLDDEDRPFRAPAPLAAGERLRCRLRIALGAVVTELRLLLHRFSSTFPQAPVPGAEPLHSDTGRRPVLNARETVCGRMQAKSPHNRLFMRFLAHETDGEKPVEPVD